MADQTKNTQKNAKEAQPNNLVAKKPKKNKSIRFDGRIALFGCRAAGKTVYISSLFHKYHGSSEGLNVDFVDEESARYLAELQNSILPLGSDVTSFHFIWFWIVAPLRMPKLL